MATVNGLTGGALYSDLQWDERGRPYRTLLTSEPKYAGGRQAGTRVYQNPGEITDRTRAGIADDPRVTQWAKEAYVSPTTKNGMWKQQPKWNPRTGQYDEDFNWDNLAILGAGSIIGAPFLLGSGAGGLGPGMGGLFGGGGAVVPPTAGTVNGLSIVPPTVAAGGSAAVPTATGGAMGWLGKLGLTVKDLIGGGADIFKSIYQTNAASAAAQTNDEYLRQALEFAKQQYADTTKLEKERWDATEARRAPYRAASQDTLAEFRKLLGMD